MTVQIHCPFCEETYDLDEFPEGAHTICERCGHEFVIDMSVVGPGAKSSQTTQVPPAPPKPPVLPGSSPAPEMNDEPKGKTVKSAIPPRQEIHPSNHCPGIQIPGHTRLHRDCPSFCRGLPGGKCFSPPSTFRRLLLGDYHAGNRRTCIPHRRNPPPRHPPDRTADDNRGTLGKVRPPVHRSSGVCNSARRTTLCFPALWRRGTGYCVVGRWMAGS